MAVTTRTAACKVSNKRRKAICRSADSLNKRSEQLTLEGHVKKAKALTTQINMTNIERRWQKYALLAPLVKPLLSYQLLPGARRERGRDAYQLSAWRLQKLLPLVVGKIPLPSEKEQPARELKGVV